MHRTTAIAATALSILCCIPQEAACFVGSGRAIEGMAKNFVEQNEIPDDEAFQAQIIELVQFLENSDDPLGEGCELIQTMLDQVNAKYGCSLTFPQILQQVRENIHYVQISEIENELMAGLQELEEYTAKDVDNKKWNECFYKDRPEKKKHKKWGGKGIIVVLVLSAATVTVCLVQPAAIPAVIQGASAIGCAALGAKLGKK